MKTKVELRLDQKVNAKIIKQVLRLSKVNTSESNEDVEILKDELDDKILIIKFESQTGKQSDLAYEILKSYSHFLDSYNDISIYFETKRKKLGEEKITKNDVVKLVENFCRSFDERDWDLMFECLGEKIEVDYQSFRGKPKHILKSVKYIAQRKIGLEGLKTKHRIKNYKTSRYGEDIKCESDFEIKRYEIGSEEYYHSYGKYEFWIKKKKGKIKIFKIKQLVEKNEGNKNIHGAFKK